MSAIQAKCESCGRVLQYPDEICARCDKKLYLESLNSAKRGEIWGSIYAKSKGKPKYICPACLGRFPKVEMIAWPPVVPWYKFQSIRFCCPVCRKLLKSRYQTTSRRLQAGTSGIVMLQIFFGIPNNLIFILFFCVEAILIPWGFVISYREFRDENLYIQDEIF